MNVSLTLPAKQTIDPQSLPLVGRVKSWLDLKSIAMTQQKQDVTLQVAWQIFGTVEKAQTLNTPSFVLKTQGPHAQKIVVPEQEFYYSPVLPLPPLKDIKRRDNLVAPLMDTTTPILWLGVSFALFSLCGFMWLWLKDRLPWLPYRAGPMTLLLRQLTVAKQTLTEQQLRDIHTALNKSAGISLYPDNLNTLFVNAPYFVAEQQQVEQFFKQSWAVFYPKSTGDKAHVESAPTMQWVNNIAMAERLFRRQQ
jgi:hypothetical protein